MCSSRARLARWAGLSVTALLSTRWRCQPPGVGSCGARRCVCACAGAVKMAPPSYPVCSPRSAVAHPSSVFSSRLLPASSVSVTRPQAVTLSRVLSQMRLFSPAPYFRRAAASTPSALCGRVSRATADAGRTQESSPNRAAAGAQRLRPGCQPPQKKFAS